MGPRAGLHRCGNFRPGTFHPVATRYTDYRIGMPHCARVNATLPGTSCKCPAVSRKSIEFRCWGFPSFVITNFSVTVSTFRDWFRWIRMWPLGWQVGYPHYNSISQTLSAVEPILIAFVLYGMINSIINIVYASRGCAVAQLLKALRYKPEDRGFGSRWGYWNLSLVQSFRPHYDPVVGMRTRNLSWGVKTAGA